MTEPTEQQHPHPLTMVSHSWGETEECDTCQKILRAWSEDGTELGYIPAGVRWLPTEPPPRRTS